MRTSTDILRTSSTRPAAAVVAELVKARLTALVLLTTFIGFYMGERGALHFALMFHALAGTALVAAGASALNQLLEREEDAKMRRTQSRPLPSGQLDPVTVMIFGGLSATAGLLYLALAVNLLTSVIGAVTLVCYLFIYTPLKRVTWLNTLAGAVPGALPPVMGWTAARGELTAESLVLFAIVAFWQIPHFMSIAWIYRDEYAKAGFKMLPVVEPDGFRTGRQAANHALALLFVSLCPFVFNMAGGLYLGGALILSAGYLWCAIQFLRQLRHAQAELSLVRARQLFLASICYLPLLLAVMVWGKVR